jgi:hypothetical protein
MDRKRAYMKEYMKAYLATAKAKEKQRIYNASPKGVARKEKYAVSAKGEAAKTAYWERVGHGITGMMESRRTDIIDLQILLGRELRSDEKDWWFIVCHTHADRFLRFREEACL